MLSMHLKLMGVVTYDNDSIMSIFYEFVNKYFEIRSLDKHFFVPHGITITAILAESHAAISTWPEDSLIHFDIFMCNDIFKNDYNNIFEEIRYLFKPQKMSAIVIDRAKMDVIINSSFLYT